MSDDVIDPIIPRRWAPFNDDRPVAEEVERNQALRIVGSYHDAALDGTEFMFRDRRENRLYHILFMYGRIMLRQEGTEG